MDSRQDRIADKAFITSFEYNGNDQVTSITYPSGRRIQFLLNNAGQPTRIFEAAANRNYADLIQYHASGGVKSYAAGNGTTTTISYDADRYWTASIVSGPLNLTYGDYDRLGNPRAIADTRSGYSQILEYDALDRLTEASGVWGGPTIYGYDAYGNRTGAGYQYEPGTLRLSNQDGVAFTYDNNGNALSIGSATFTYTPHNQVETAAVGGSTETYAYDADDQRVRKTDGTSTTYYLRDPNGQLLTEWKDPGTQSGHLRDYIYLGAHLLSAVSRNSTDDPADPEASVVSTKSHRYATSWQVMGGAGGNARISSGISSAARKSTHPDMPRTGLRLGISPYPWVPVDILTTGPTLPSAAEEPRQAAVFVEFEVERYPLSTDAEWLGIDGVGWYSSSDDALRLFLTPGGQLILKLDGGYNPDQVLWTSPVVGLKTTHTLELRFGFNSNAGPYAVPNPPYENLTSWVEIVYDGDEDEEPITLHGVPNGSWTSNNPNPLGLDSWNGLGVFGQVNLKSPAPSVGLLMNVFRAAVLAEKSGGALMADYRKKWRTTLIQTAGPGTYAQWTDGQPDWRARSIVAGDHQNYPHGFAPPVATPNGGAKISYKMESMLSKGVTGRIGVVMVGVRMQYASANTKVFIRRNGVETILNDFIMSTGQTRWYRVANTGWAPTDVVEVGVTSGGAGTNWLKAVALLVEHNSPEPAPLTETSVRVETYSYAGNGSAQTIEMGVDMLPTALLIVPVNPTSGMEQHWWWDSRQGAGTMSQAVASFGRVWPQKGKFHVIHSDAYSANKSGVNYLAIAVFDPSGRYVLPFGVAKSSDAVDDNFVHALRYPQSGALATDFTPDFVFGGLSVGTGGDETRATLYRGPGHVGDSTAKLGVVQASDADRIQAIGAGTVTLGSTINSNIGDHAFWAGRVNDGESTQRFMAVTSYVGDGTPSRNIALTLNGASPVLTFVVPTNATAKVYRVAGDTTGRSTAQTNAVANSITAMTANQITVGSALNALGVTYDVWAITTGFVAPK